MQPSHLITVEIISMYIHISQYPEQQGLQGNVMLMFWGQKSEEKCPVTKKENVSTSFPEDSQMVPEGPLKRPHGNEKNNE